jgi:hypothetical protein
MHMSTVTVTTFGSRLKICLKRQRTSLQAFIVAGAEHFHEMKRNLMLLFSAACLVSQTWAVALRAAPAPAGAAAPVAAPVESVIGVGNVKDFAHLLPFHPRGQQELLMKTRCVNFLNHLLEKSAYAPDAVGSLMPTCKWDKAECAALKDDLVKRLKKGSSGPAPAPAPAAAVLAQSNSESLAQEWSDLFQPVPERKAPKDKAVTWINGPRGPQPDFITQGGMDESIYGWCDVMYDMMRKKAINELDEEQKKPKEDKPPVSKSEMEAEEDEVVLMKYGHPL